MKLALILSFLVATFTLPSCHTVKATANDSTTGPAVSSNPPVAPDPNTGNAIDLNNPTSKSAEEFSIDCLDKTTAQPDVICDEDNRPVCGCNNQNYKNACEANKVGVRYYSWGKCPKTTKRGSK